MARLKRTGISLRWARGSNSELLVMLLAHFHMCFIVSWAKATEPTCIYCIHGRANDIHTYGKNKGPCISLCSHMKRFLKGDSVNAHFGFVHLALLLWALLVWNHMEPDKRAAVPEIRTSPSLTDWAKWWRHALCKVAGSIIKNKHLVNKRHLLSLYNLLPVALFF